MENSLLERNEISSIMLVIDIVGFLLKTFHKKKYFHVFYVSSCSIMFAMFNSFMKSGVLDFY